jgi:predicted secreted protein
MFNVTFRNILLISWWSVLFVGVPVENCSSIIGDHQKVITIQMLFDLKHSNIEIMKIVGSC